MSTQQLDLVQREGQTLSQQVEALAVSDAESFEMAAQFRRALKGYLRRVADLTKPVIEQAQKSLDAAREQRRILEGPALAAEAVLNRKLVAYEQDQRRIAAEAQRQADEDRRRQQEEADLREALEADANGQAPPAPTPVFVPPAPVPEVPKVSGLSFRSVWKARVTKLETLVRAVADGKVPLNHLEPSMTVLNARARAEKSTLAIPGVEAVEERISSGGA